MRIIVMPNSHLRQTMGCTDHAEAPKREADACSRNWPARPRHRGSSLFSSLAEN